MNRYAKAAYFHGMTRQSQIVGVGESSKTPMSYPRRPG